MSELTKGVVVMAGFIGQALSVLLKENDALISHAKTLGGVAACRWHERTEETNIATGEKTWRYTISFDCEEDLQMFDNAVRGIVDETTEERR